MEYLQATASWTFVRSIICLGRVALTAARQRVNSRVERPQSNLKIDAYKNSRNCKERFNVNFKLLYHVNKKQTTTKIHIHFFSSDIIILSFILRIYTSICDYFLYIYCYRFSLHFYPSYKIVFVQWQFFQNFSCDFLQVSPSSGN